MAGHTASPVGDPVVITLYDDRADRETPVSVSPELAILLAYADAWAREESRRDNATLTFSSTLAAMVAGEPPLCGWLRLHLALRGSAAESVTKGRSFPGLPPPTGRVTTTHSFRRALEQATQIARDRTLDVRHLMAAYPVVKAYHAGDFLKFRIDRRAWCLALADHLQRTASPDEIREWVDYERLAPEVLMPRYRPDLPAGADLLGVGREVEAFAMLIAAPRTAMPLSIGVFGAWGSGKSYFMTRVEERVATLAQPDGHGGPYLHRIAQVRFNAWHYSEGNVVASLVDQIFRNLRFGPGESSVVLAKRRAEALAQVAAVDQEGRTLQSHADAAAAEESRLREEWQRINAEHDVAVQRTSHELTTAQASVAEAEQRVDDVLAAQALAIDAAQRTAPAQAAVQLVTDTILKDPTIAKLDADVRHAADEARWLGANRQTIAWGIAVVALTAIAALFAQQLRDSPLVTTLAAAIVAAAPFAGRAMALLRELSEKGTAFQKAVRDRTEAAVTQIKEEHARLLQEQQAAVESARAKVEALRAQRNALADTARQAQAALVAGEQRRRQLSEQLAVAAAGAAAARKNLDALTVGSLLGDTIQEAADTDVFRKQLGTLSYARSFFQRLSETMMAARRESAGAGSAQPALERVVLYIDDLDRCSPGKVREVLQAVHLLLAFDLFVCMVAVDPRWIIQCLEDSPGVIPKAKAQDADLAVLGGLTTPSDYLEKIFQIPLWLRPVPAERRAALAATLLERDLGESDQRRRAIEEFSVDRLVTAAHATGAVETGQHSMPEVRIDPRELEFLQSRVSPLLDGNSRALKRFVNTYHLVKAALSEVEFDDFGNHEPYRVCMAQLALLATQRGRARLLAKLVDDASHRSTLGECLGTLGTESPEMRSIATDLTSVLLPELKELPFGRFAFWFERTRRYSFYV